MLLSLIISKNWCGHNHFDFVLVSPGPATHSSTILWFLFVFCPAVDADAHTVAHDNSSGDDPTLPQHHNNIFLFDICHGQPVFL